MKFFMLIAAFMALQVGGAFASSPPPAAVYDVEPYKGGEFFASAACITQKFDCSKNLTRRETVKMANVCASETFGVENLLGQLGLPETPYVGCAVPVRFETAASANTPLKRKWPVCCVVQRADSCGFVCHLYYNNK